MQKRLGPKILVIGHDHRETLAPEILSKYLPEN